MDQSEKILNQLMMGQQQLMMGQREILEEIKEIRKELADIRTELKTTTEATAYLARDVLILKNRIS